MSTSSAPMRPRVTPDAWEAPRIERSLERERGAGTTVELLSALTHAVRFGDPERADAIADRALAEATVVDERAELEALRAAATAAMRPDALDRLGPIVARLEVLAGRHCSPEHLAHALLARRYAAETRGERCRTRQLSVRIAALAERSRDPLLIAIAAQLRAGDLLAEGDGVRLREAVAVVLATAVESGSDLVVQSAIGVAALTEWLTTDTIPDSVMSSTDQLAACEPSMQVWHVASLMLRAAPGREDEIGRALAAATGRDLDALPRHSLWLAHLVICAELARFARDAVRGAQVASLLAPHAHLFATLGDGASIGSVRLGIAAAAEAMGDRDRARAEYREAAIANGAIGAEPWRLLAELRSAALDGRTRDASALADRAATMGMHRIAAEACRVVEPTVPLSRREIELAGVVAAGATNREIADRLHISVKTVERHLSNIFVKLELGNRVELARWVIDRGHLSTQPVVNVGANA